MKKLLLVVLVIALLIFSGWIVFDFGNNRASVEFRPEEAKRDVRSVMEKAESLLDSKGNHDSVERSAPINAPVTGEPR